MPMVIAPICPSRSPSTTTHGRALCHFTDIRVWRRKFYRMRHTSPASITFHLINNKTEREKVWRKDLLVDSSCDYDKWHREQLVPIVFPQPLVQILKRTTHSAVSYNLIVGNVDSTPTEQK